MFRDFSRDFYREVKTYGIFICVEIFPLYQKIPIYSMKKTVITKSVAETWKFAQELVSKHLQGRIITLKGSLGSGKTTLTKGILQAFGVAPKDVKSPTYSLIHEYQTSDRKIYHLDLYRLNPGDTMIESTIMEILEQSNSLMIIEWAEHIEAILPLPRTKIEIENLKGNQRKFTLHHHE